MVSKTIRRGDIWFVRLDPAEDSETKKTRPCLVLQNDIGNKYGDTTVIVPFLASGDYPFIVNVFSSKQNGLDRQRGLNLSKIRSVSMARFRNKIGAIENKYWSQIERALLVECGFINS
ncbi:type II toxin-antitoxin system PemK/MazF family toxin [Myxosarcina sp. GI1]|uniref:type II toxin-antitoxin system PemK/MazF family toxin n=1 Tax=Myxosarcina sp. GI1 TaxID=1541065 RepID=UPI0005600380|nr:type II toxin-antitoxin system PemK/MazF family toxin [Myxosarcina sp. GI1]